LDFRALNLFRISDFDIRVSRLAGGVAQKSNNSRKRTYENIHGLQNFFFRFSVTFAGFFQSVARLRSFLRNSDSNWWRRKVRAERRRK